MLNSLKQLIRTPFKATLFFLLIVASTALLVLGANLWRNTQKQIDDVESSFITIGMVTQKENSVHTSGVWNAASESYTTSVNLVYDSLIDENVLDFEGANYIVEPKHRPYYVANLYGYSHMIQVPSSAMYESIVEFEPLEDCVPSKPVQVQVKRVLFGDSLKEGDLFWFCDHHTEKPASMEAGKTYISYLTQVWGLHTGDAQAQSAIEYIASFPPYSSQRNMDGNQVADAFSLASVKDLNVDRNYQKWEEVTEAFYSENGRGQYWLNYAQSVSNESEEIPVLPADSLEILPTFHDKQSAITQGRAITEEEFENGAPVCIVPLGFASANQLEIGDKLPLSLVYSSYYFAAGCRFALGEVFTSGSRSFSRLNAEGKLYEPFWEDEYEIVGFYYTSNTNTLNATKDEIGYDLVIIPSKSVKASDENNIVDYGVMLASNTSFQIENGTIDAYMEAYTANVPEGIREHLEITFDDNGYSQVIDGLNNMRSIAILLFAVGLFAALSIIVLLLYFFIVRQKKRTAIERSLGMSKRQCRVSLASGVIVLSIVAVILGTIGSIFLLDKVQTLDLTGQAESKFSTEYSLWAREEAPIPEAETDNEDSGTPLLNLVIPAGLILLTAGLSIILVNQNLKTEPIMLLSAREE